MSSGEIVGGVRVLLFFILTSCTCAPKSAPAPVDAGVHYRKVDMHVHTSVPALPRLLRLMDERGIDVAVNLSGGWPGTGSRAVAEGDRLADCEAGGGVQVVPSSAKKRSSR